MELLCRCEKCGASYSLGDMQRLPQPSMLMTFLADILHDHVCKPLDNGSKRL